MSVTGIEPVGIFRSVSVAFCATSTPKLVDVVGFEPNCITDINFHSTISGLHNSNLRPLVGILTHYIRNNAVFYLTNHGSLKLVGKDGFEPSMFQNSL